MRNETVYSMSSLSKEHMLERRRRLVALKKQNSVPDFTTRPESSTTTEALRGQFDEVRMRLMCLLTSGEQEGN